MTIHKALFSLVVGASVVVMGCGNAGASLDSGTADHAASATCAVNNGGCSITPMVPCETSSSGEVFCRACPTGYAGNGRTCTSIVETDECDLGTHNCSPDATCRDTAAAYTCTCLPNYGGDGVACAHGCGADVGDSVRYRLDALLIPTPEQAEEGSVVGHDVDHAGDRCGVPDFVGSVDNVLIGLATDLLAVDVVDPIDLQEGIREGLQLFVSVGVGTNCVVLQWENQEGDSLAVGQFLGVLDGSGRFRARRPTVELMLPYATGTETVNLTLALTNVVATGIVGADSLTDVVISGALERSSLEAAVMELLATRQDDVTFDDIEPLLEARYDVQVDGQCTALSFGLTATATRVAP